MNPWDCITEKGSIKDFFQWAEREHELLDAYDSGSRVICNPPVLDTDDDKLILVRDIEVAGAWFSGNGWANCLGDWEAKPNKDDGQRVDAYTVELATGARFQAWRREEVNVIMTDDVVLHMRSRAATLLAKELNLKDKAERIELFRCIKFGEGYERRFQ